MEEMLQAKPFVFRRRFERVDWRKLASVNLDQIARDLDFGSLQDNLTNIAFCNIELELDMRLIDPNFVKLFRLGQLTVEYLLYSQEYLSDTIISLEGRVKEQNKNEENLCEKLRMVEKQLEKIKKEGHKRKKLIMDQQHLIEAGADNFHKCLLCPKAFMNSTFLQNHCIRRHGQTYQDIKDANGADKENEIPPKISEQLDEIKERLIFTESQLAEERRSIKEANSKEASLLTERDAQHLTKLEEWRDASEARHKQEVERIQNMLMTELREMQEKQSATQKSLEAAQQGLSGFGRPSNLGTSIRDDLDVERDMLHREREEVMRLKEQVKLQVDNMQERIQSELAAHTTKVKKETLANQNTEKQEDLERIQRALEEKQEEINQMRKLHRVDKKRDRSSKHAVGQESTDAGLSVTEPRPQPRPQPLTNGHQTSREDFTEKKKKTLTFADDSNISGSGNKLTDKVVVPDIMELPPTKSTLSSGEYTISETDEEDTTLADASTTNQSMSTLGTLDLTGKSKQLHEAITQNPKLMQDMREQLQQVFNNEMMRWDVHPDSDGLSSTKLSTKLQHLSHERNKMEKKYKMFRETRLGLIKQVDDLAKAEAKSQDSLMPKGGRRSPKDSKRLTGTMSSVTATMESSTWGTTSSKWTSSDRKEQVPDLSTDEESDSDSDEPLPKYKPKVPTKHDSPVQHHSKTQSPALAAKKDTASESTPQPSLRSGSGPSRQSSGWATIEDDVDDGGFTPASAPPRKQAIKMPEMDPAVDSDWDEDEDDLSELEELGAGTRAAPLKASGGSTSGSTIRASGVVGNIAAKIESQLLGRKGKAPVGGVNTLVLPSDDRVNSASPITPDIPKLDGSDDEDFSMSSVEAQLAPHSATNTYSSRQWGQGSSSNTLNASGKPGVSLVPSGDKASSITSDNVSLTSVTGTAQKGDSGSDWSADSDFDNL